MSKDIYHEASRSIEHCYSHDGHEDMAFWEDDGSQHNAHIWTWFDWQSGYYDDYDDEVTSEQRARLDAEFAHLKMAEWIPTHDWHGVLLPPHKKEK